MPATMIWQYGIESGRNLRGSGFGLLIIGVEYRPVKPCGLLAECMEHVGHSPRQHLSRPCPVVASREI